MSNLLNAVKEKFNTVKQNAMLRTVLICVLALLLIFSVTLAWYINNLGLWGMEFTTGNIDFNAYVYDANGKRLVGPASPDDEDKSSYINAPLFTIENAQVGTVGTVYIAVESTGSLGIQYRIAFDVTGKNESATAYLGGYKYNVTKVTDKVVFSTTGDINVSGCPEPDKIADEIITIDRNAIHGTLAEQNGYDVYRFDYKLVEKNQEYTSNSLNFFLNIFATQVGGDFEETDERGFTYYCATREDIDRAKVEAYPGDVIKLTSNIIYYGDLVFNKPISLQTNDFTLTVNGNLVYDYVLGNDLKVDAGGLGQVVVQCTKEGVGGNFTIKAPLSDVTLVGSNASTGDFVVEKTLQIDATNTYGAPGVSFNNVRIVDEKNSRKAILLESNTRATISFGTTIGLLQSVPKANNIEIINNGVINDINLSNMALLPQTNSPQIYILNNNDIMNPIALPEWSVKFQQDADGKCTGNTRIIQSYSGSTMTVSGICVFDNEDIEVEKYDTLVEQIIPGNDSRLKIYYQDVDGEVTSIQSILENYLNNEATTGCHLNEVMQLEIISVGTKAITNSDLSFMNSNNMLSLSYLDMERANIYDGYTATSGRLASNIFSNVQKYKTIVLPQNLVAIGDNAFSHSKIQNPVTVPAGVETFGTNWFSYGSYVAFAASVPNANAVKGLSNVSAIFVEEPYIESYKSVFSTYSTRIYPVSVLDETKQHFVRNLRDDEWEITYYVSGEDTVIGKNVTLDGTQLKIVSVYANAYRHNFTLSKVDFADTVENLGAYNFYANKNIVEVNLRNIKTIGYNVFNNCTTLSKVVFGDYLEVIDWSAFSNCTSLEQEVILPPTMQKIGSSAFYQTKITGIDAGGTKEIGENVFYSCPNLTWAKLANVESVSVGGVNGLFTYCVKLVSVDFSSLTTVAGTGMFNHCSSLRELYFSTKEDSFSLGDKPFTNVDLTLLKVFVPLEHLSFFQGKAPGGISTNSIYPQGEKMGELLVHDVNIGEYIVMNNGDGSYTLVTSNLNHAGNYSVPNTYNSNPITDIFANCFRNQTFTNVTMTFGDNLKTIGNSAVNARNGLKGVVFGKSLESIGTYTFANCSDLTGDVILPATMESIGTNAFLNCKITSVNTGGTKTIGGRAFYSNTSLVYAVMPEVTTIGTSSSNEVFCGCGSLVSVDMPKVSSVAGSSMFSYCGSLREIYMGARNNSLTLGTSPFLYVNTAQIRLYVPESEVSFYAGRKIVDSNQVYARGEKLGDYAVKGFVLGDFIMLKKDSGYTLVTTNLDFEGEVTLPTEFKGLPVTGIGERAFYHQTFTNVSMILGDEVASIGSKAFYGKTGLTDIVMDGVQSIGSEAFADSGIKILNGPSLTSIGGSAFIRCTKLTTANLPVLETVESTNVFAGCSSLKLVYFVNVKSLNSTTFAYSYALENITINRQIESDKSNMPETMTIEKAAPCKIYVPFRSMSAYTDTWSGKPVVSYDLTVEDSGHTYILTETNEGRYVLLDFMPGNSVTTLTMPGTVSVDGEYIDIYGIREGAFSTVAATLKNLTLSATVAQLSQDALNECTVLEKIQVVTTNKFFKSVNGVLYSKDGKMLVKYPAGKSGAFDMSGTSYASTVAIGVNAFTNATKLTEITFPASLMVIDGTAFTNCSGLKTVTFTGTTPPVLMGSGMFDTGVDGFKMVIPTTSASVVSSYLCAYNFDEYAPYIDLGGYNAPNSSASRNQVSLGAAAVSEITTDEQETEPVEETE